MVSTAHSSRAGPADTQGVRAQLLLQTLQVALETYTLLYCRRFKTDIHYHSAPCRPPRPPPTSRMSPRTYVALTCDKRASPDKSMLRYCCFVLHTTWIGLGLGLRLGLGLGLGLGFGLGLNLSPNPDPYPTQVCPPPVPTPAPPTPLSSTRPSRRRYPPRLVV